MQQIFFNNIKIALNVKRHHHNTSQLKFNKQLCDPTKLLYINF